MQFVLHVTCSCISHAYILSFQYTCFIWIAWDFFDCLSFFPPLSVYEPKRKSTPARNPLHSGASSSSDSAPLSLRFHNDDAHKAFSENFSRRGVHYAKSYRRTSLTLTFPLSFIVGNGSHCVTFQSLVLLCLFRSFTTTCTRLIVQYLSSLLAFEVCTFLSHRSLLRMCFRFLG